MPDTDIVFRPFLNTDPPLLVQVWNQQPSFRGLATNLNSQLLELHVFSKPYFERDGLLLALQGTGANQRAVGFIHCSFDVRADLGDLDFETGVISQLRVVDCERRAFVEDQLIQLGLNYLKKRQAVRCYFGGRFPQAPFYLGLYGGSRIPGVMAGDRHVQDALVRNGFEVERTIAILERQLDRTVKAPGGRQQLSVRRNYLVNAISDPIEQSWWECCTLGLSERDRFQVARKKDNHVDGKVSYWDMQPLSSIMPDNYRGLYDLVVNRDGQRQGLATHLVCESLKRLAANGATMVEAQTDLANIAAIRLFEKLEFVMVEQAQSMVKRLG